MSFRFLTYLECLSRCVLLGAWLTATAMSWVGGGNYLGGALAAVFPHAKCSSVILGHMGDRIWVPTWEDRQHVSHSLCDLGSTPALGYQCARTYANYVAHPNWLGELCRSNPDLDGAIFSETEWLLTEPSGPGETLRRKCYKGVLP